MKISHKDLREVRKKNPEKKIVFCDGTFDLLHLAHIKHLQNVHTYGDLLVAGVMSDEWVKEKKGKNRPILSQNERSEILDAIKYVDYTLVLYNDDSGERIRTSEAIELLRPNIFVTTDQIWNSRVEEFQKLQVELRIVKPTPSITHTSTSTIIENILRQKSSLET